MELRKSELEVRKVGRAQNRPPQVYQVLKGSDLILKSMQAWRRMVKKKKKTRNNLNMLQEGIAKE